MNFKLRGIWVAVVFLVGCAVGGVSGRLVVPVASAQQAATLTKWEYTCADVVAKRGEADKFGAQGWEAFSVTGATYFCFKRPKG